MGQTITRLQTHNRCLSEGQVACRETNFCQLSDFALSLRESSNVSDDAEPLQVTLLHGEHDCFMTALDLQDFFFLHLCGISHWYSLF